MIKSIDSLMPDKAATGGVFVLGNFDGVHRGHHRVIDQAVERARALGVPSRLLTFEPHPRSVFWPDHVPFRLTTAVSKEKYVKQYGIDAVVTLPFTLELAHVAAQDFATDILARYLRAEHVVAGYDFTFGYKRGGDMAKLAAWLAPYGLGTTEVLAEQDDHGTVFSSTRIRELLQRGEITAANAMLGRAWTLAGTVIKGAQRGRTIGVPTANIALGDYLRPAFGVYAVRAGRVGEDLTYRGVANIGMRPTVGGQSENLEAHLFDFDQDIYGQEWQFALTHFLRGEQKFERFEDLRQQIGRDIVAAQSALS